MGRLAQIESGEADEEAPRNRTRSDPWRSGCRSARLSGCRDRPLDPRAEKLHPEHRPVQRRRLDLQRAPGGAPGSPPRTTDPVPCRCCGPRRWRCRAWSRSASRCSGGALPRSCRCRCPAPPARPDRPARRVRSDDAALPGRRRDQRLPAGARASRLARRAGPASRRWLRISKVASRALNSRFSTACCRCDRSPSIHSGSGVQLQRRRPASTCRGPGPARSAPGRAARAFRSSRVSSDRFGSRRTVRRICCKPLGHGAERLRALRAACCS